jgi:large subunit ribosomal protein L29
MAKTKELGDLTDPDLFQRLSDLKEELFNLRFQNATGQLDSYSQLGATKKEVARCLTELRGREIAAAEAIDDTTTTSEESA